MAPIKEKAIKEAYETPPRKIRPVLLFASINLGEGRQGA